MAELLVRLFLAALRLKQEFQIAWAMAVAEMTPLGPTPGLCVCGYGFDDHSTDGECPLDEYEEEEVWAIDWDDEGEDDGDGA